MLFLRVDKLTINSISKYNTKIIFKKAGLRRCFDRIINSVTSKFFCIFNADGFESKEIDTMKKINHQLIYFWIKI